MPSNPTSLVPDHDRPFEAPWQAQVFGLTVACHEAGLFSWKDWTEALGAALAEAGAAADGNEGYWRAWLSAFEAVICAGGQAVPAELSALARAWQAAARATPHGQAIALAGR